MSTIAATATEMQNNFGKYMNMMMNGQQLVLTKNGKEIGRFVPQDEVVSYLTDSLTGVIKGNYDLDEEKEKSLKEKHEIID